MWVLLYYADNRYCDYADNKLTDSCGLEGWISTCNLINYKYNLIHYLWV